MTASTNLQRNVVRRVRTIHALRPLTGSAAGAFVLLGISLYILGREVFVAQVLRNMPSISDLSAVLGFIEAAFFNTTFAVQALSVLAFMAGLWLIREIVRLLASNDQRFA